MAKRRVALIAVVLGCSLVVHGQDIASTVATAGIPIASALAQQDATRSATRLQPFTPSQRWAYYIYRTYSPHRLVLLAAETAMDHGLREPACWDRGLGSYVNRYSRAFDRRLIRNTAEFGAGLLTGEDLRYRPLGPGPLHGRVWNAVRSAFVAQMPNGTARPAYTRFTAATLAEVSTAHWIGKRLAPYWVAQSLAWGTLDQIETNLLDEFGPDLRRIGGRVCKRLHHVPEMFATPRR